jgi:hypothetical protein
VPALRQVPLLTPQRAVSWRVESQPAVRLPAAASLALLELALLQAAPLAPAAAWVDQEGS